MKFFLTILVCSFTLITTVNADIIRVEAGAGVWMQTPSEMITANKSVVNGTDTANEVRKNRNYAWMFIKHPLPIISNIRLEYASLVRNGMASGTFDDFYVPQDVKANSHIDMKQFDIIPYYNILDNTFWATLDIGIDFKAIDITYEANNVTLNNNQTGATYKESKNVLLPLLYLRTRFQLMGLGVEADVKYLDYDSNLLYDARIKFDYTFDITPVIQPAIEVGYRVQHLESKKLDNINLDLDFSGPYVGLMLRF